MCLAGSYSFSMMYCMNKILIFLDSVDTFLLVLRYE